jgi:hypothetical protein
MKKTIRLFVSIAMTLLLFNSTLFAQDDTPPTRPEYITVTTMHWNMDNDDFDMEEWIAVEKEFLDKVTMKNEYVMGSGFYMHRYTPDNSELIYVRTYASWEDIDKAGDRDDELAKEAWHDKEARDAFYDKQAGYYSDFHSDEIYATMSGAKPLTEAPGDDMILYVRKSHFAYPDDGTMEEFGEMRTEYTENVIHKNEYIKGYFPNSHFWGSDRTEFVEAFLLNSMDDLDKMFGRTGELVKEHWPDDEARKEMNKKAGTYFTGVHGDYIYTMVEQLSK